MSHVSTGNAWELAKWLGQRQSARRLLLVGAVVGQAAVACSDTRQEASASASQGLMGGTNIPASPIGGDASVIGASETSVTVLPPYENATYLLIGYNSTGSCTAGWSWTNVATFTSFTSHSCKDPFFTWSKPTELSSDGSNYGAPTTGDPNVLSTGRPGQAVYVTTASSSADPKIPEDVIIAISVDNGVSFARSSSLIHILTTANTGQGVDQPVAVLDQNVDPNTGSPPIWIWWRTAQHSPNGPVSYLHKVWVDANQNLNLYSGYPKKLPAGPPQTNPNLADAVIGTGHTNNGNAYVFLVYPDNFVDTPANGCPNTNLDMISWYMIGSIDGGSSWGAPQLIYSDAAWPECNIGGLNAKCGNRARPRFVFDTSNGHCYVAFNHSYAVGTSKYGTRAVVYSSADGANWSQAFIGTHEGGTDKPRYYDQFGLAMAYTKKTSEMTGRIMVTWNDTFLEPANPAAVALFGALSLDDGHTWTTPTQISNGSGVPWQQPSTCSGNTCWGDYQGMDGDSATGFFYPAWADLRAPGATDSTIYATKVQP
jgi:hypothetical protein